MAFLRYRFARLLPMALMVSLGFIAVNVSADEAGFRPIFNGVDLAGWEGDPALWSVQDGAITGTTTDASPLPYNKFLIWRGGTTRNFELRAKVRQVGNNSGIQYRSRELKEVGPWSVGGYQCDIHSLPQNNGMLYDERDRGIIAQNGQTIIVDEKGGKWLTNERPPFDVNVEEWNVYSIIARGNHLIHKINDHTVTDVIDHQESHRELEGILAFQVHRGPAMRVQIKDVLLKELPDGDVLSPTQAPVPVDARKLERPAPTPKKGAAKKEAQKKTAGTAPRNKSAIVAGRTRGQQVGRPPSTTGIVLGENKATPLERLKVKKDFQVELLYSVPNLEQGSWVNLCLDNKGRILASDQYGGLYRFPPPPPGQSLDPKQIEKVPAAIRAVNGMVWAFGALYVAVNDYENKIPSGLYRITDSNGDDQLEKVELLREMHSHRDHGVHALCASTGRTFAILHHRQRRSGQRLRSLSRSSAVGRGPSPAAHARRPRLHARCPCPRRYRLPRLARWEGLRDLFFRLSQYLRRRLQPRWRTVHLRRRHGI